MKEPKGKSDAKVKNLTPKKLSVQQEEAVKGGLRRESADQFP